MDTAARTAHRGADGTEFDDHTFVCGDTEDARVAGNHVNVKGQAIVT